MGTWQWVLSIAGGITVVFAALGALAKAVKWVFGLIKDLREFLEDWRGDDPRPEIGYAGRPGVMARLHGVEQTVKSVEQRVESVHYQVVPNGGGSLRDSVNRIETAVATAVEEASVR